MNLYYRTDDVYFSIMKFFFYKYLEMCLSGSQSYTCTSFLYIYGNIRYWRKSMCFGVNLFFSQTRRTAVASAVIRNLSIQSDVHI